MVNSEQNTRSIDGLAEGVAGGAGQFFNLAPSPDVGRNRGCAGRKRRPHRQVQGASVSSTRPPPRHLRGLADLKRGEIWNMVGRSAFGLRNRHQTSSCSPRCRAMANLADGRRQWRQGQCDPEARSRSRRGLQTCSRKFTRSCVDPTARSAVENVVLSSTGSSAEGRADELHTVGPARSMELMRSSQGKGHTFLARSMEQIMARGRLLCLRQDVFEGRRQEELCCVCIDGCVPSAGGCLRERALRLGPSPAAGRGGGRGLRQAKSGEGVSRSATALLLILPRPTELDFRPSPASGARGENAWA